MSVQSREPSDAVVKFAPKGGGTDGIVYRGITVRVTTVYRRMMLGMAS
jgi:hypothetical protein